MLILSTTYPKRELSFDTRVEETNVSEEDELEYVPKWKLSDSDSLVPTTGFQQRHAHPVENILGDIRAGTTTRSSLANNF